MVSGCAQKYSKEQYDAVTNELAAAKEELQKAKSENEAGAKSLAEMRRMLDQTNQTLSTVLSEKQALLDKDIQCLEEKKALVKQVAQATAMSQEKKEALARMNRTHDFMAALLESERLADQVYIIKTQEKIKIVIPQKALFPTQGSAWLTPKGTKLVRKIAGGINKLAPSALEISGHTDNTLPAEVKNVYSTNWQLAHERALSVLGVLLEARVKKDIMSAVSFSDTKPIGDNSTESGRAMNRRVEIVIIP